MDGLYETLDALQRAGIPMGMITNGKEVVQNRKIDVLGIRKYMRCITVSEAVGVQKPDQQIFALTLAQMGMEASVSWYVGDHPANDIIGASMAGLTAIWLRGSHSWPATIEEPRHQIDKLEELIGLVGDL